jgi:hypothetical protein
MHCARLPLLLRDIEDHLHERGIDLSRRTVRFLWHRIGPMFAFETRPNRAESLRVAARTRGDLAANEGPTTVAKARGVRLGNPNGAAALRRAVKRGAPLRRDLARNADRRAQDLAEVVASIRAEGHQSLRGIAGELNHRGYACPARWAMARLNLEGNADAIGRPPNQGCFSLRRSRRGLVLVQQQLEVTSGRCPRSDQHMKDERPNQRAR